MSEFDIRYIGVRYSDISDIKRRPSSIFDVSEFDIPIYGKRIDFRVRYISDIPEFDTSIYRSYDKSMNRNFRYKIQHTIYV